MLGTTLPIANAIFAHQCGFSTPTFMHPMAKSLYTNADRPLSLLCWVLVKQLAILPCSIPTKTEVQR
jgi:hypothetical protein